MAEFKANNVSLSLGYTGPYSNNIALKHIAQAETIQNMRSEIYNNKGAIRLNRILIGVEGALLFGVVGYLVIKR